MHLPRALLAALILALAALAAALPARAADLDAALARLAADSYGETEAAVGLIARSGDPRALTLVEALSEGRLLIAPDRRVLVRDRAGALAEGATGAPAALLGSELKPVRLNNRVRRAIEAASGELSLFAADPARRLEAAQSVFKARNLAAQAVVAAAIPREREARVKRALLEASAALAFTAPTTPELERIAAISVLADRGDADAQAVLRSLAPGASPRLREAAARAVAEIDQRLALLAHAQNLFYGLSLGSVLLLAAIGLAITFGVMGVINMAHGEMVMIGAYVTFAVQELIRSRSPHLFDASLAIALPLAFLTAGAIGVLIERGVIRVLYNRPLETLLATWGVSLILQQGVRSLFGANNREVGNPGFMSGSVEVLGLALTWNRVWIIVFAACVFAVLLLVLRFTSFGLKMRAVVQNRRMASSMGIRTPLVDALTFGLGSGIAGIAGVALSQIDNVSPNLGQAYIIDSFLVVVFGGVGSLWGALVAALTLGVANKFLEPLAGAVLAKILVLVFIILFIQKRPRGLFALKGRAVEA